jgi:hypothetical protein
MEVRVSFVPFTVVLSQKEPQTHCVGCWVGDGFWMLGEEKNLLPLLGVKPAYSQLAVPAVQRLSHI